MCGRYDLHLDQGRLASLFGLDPAAMPRLEPRYNIAPSQPVPIVRDNRDRGLREMMLVQWGLVPRWAEDPSIGQRMVNARGETAAEKNAFKAAMRYRRCLLPATGFYEWASAPGGKQPYRFHREDDAPFALAGLYEHWHGPNGEQLDTATILTTDANETVRPIHERMPVVVEHDAWDRWLNPTAEKPEDVAELLRPAPDDFFTAYPVSRRVNSPKQDDPSLIEPDAGDQPTLF